jgi:hypothetical protein
MPRFGIATFGIVQSSHEALKYEPLDTLRMAGETPKPEHAGRQMNLLPSCGESFRMNECSFTTSPHGPEKQGVASIRERIGRSIYGH